MRLILCFLLVVLLTLSSRATQADSNTSEGMQSGEQQESDATATSSLSTDLDASSSPDITADDINNADVDSQESKGGDARKRKRVEVRTQRGGVRTQRRAFRPPSPPSGHTDPSPFK